MSLLSLIIMLSVGLAAIALLGGVATIVSQAIRQQLERRRSQRRDLILRQILQGLEQPDWDLALVRLMSRNRRLSADLFSEMSELIRGENRARVLALCREASVDRWLLQQLKSWHGERRRLAADSLRLFPGDETIEALRAVLDDRSAEVRLTAAMSLAALDAMPSMGTLVEKLVEPTRNQSLLLQRLIESVAVSRPAEVMELVRGKIGKTFLRPIALSALAKAGHLELSGEIGSFIDDADPEVRAAALASIAVLGDFSAKDRIKRALSDSVQFVRVRAIASARTLELRELAPELTSLLKDENWWVRFRAGEALAALGQPVPEPRDRVVKLLPAPERRTPVRRGAA